MKKSKAIKIALEIMEECKKRPNDCIGCSYNVNAGDFIGECLVMGDERQRVAAPSHWLLNELLGDEI